MGTIVWPVRLGMALMKIAGWTVLPVLLLTMSLGYTGDADLASLANGILILAILACGALFTVGLVIWVVERKSAAR